VMVAFVGRRDAGECGSNTQNPDQLAHGAPQSEFRSRGEAGSRRRRRENSTGRNIHLRPSEFRTGSESTEWRREIFDV
jgi:hypothetical protein